MVQRQNHSDIEGKDSIGRKSVDGRVRKTLSRVHVTDPPHEDLAPGVDIHHEHAEILFGGFIDATGDITRPVNQWPSSPSLFYADHLAFYEINSHTRQFT